jgi:general secretion pathway protein D
LIAGQRFAGIDKTEAKTNLISKDGQTIIIGGLIREDITKSRAGIPFLSQIPILGYLFGNTVNETERSELIILLTPRVMRNIQEAKDITSEYINRFTETNVGVTREELMRGLEREKQENQTPNPSSP